MIASLQMQVKRLMITVRGSRQERINPDQLLLFNEAEMQQLADELEQGNQAADQAIAEPNGEAIKDAASDGATNDDVSGDLRNTAQSSLCTS